MHFHLPLTRGMFKRAGCLDIPAPKVLPIMVNNLNFRPVSSFRGLRKVPLVALSFNSIFPELTLSEEGVAFRIISRHFLPFAEIDTVDTAWRFAHQVTIIPRKGPWTFSFNYFEQNSPKALLRELEKRGVPLTPKARHFSREAALT